MERRKEGYQAKKRGSNGGGGGGGGGDGGDSNNDINACLSALLVLQEGEDIVVDTDVVIDIDINTVLLPRLDFNYLIP